jgi:hypothetical protein
VVAGPGEAMVALAWQVKEKNRAEGAARPKISPATGQRKCGRRSFQACADLIVQS